MAFDITPLTEQLDALMTEVRFEVEGGRVLAPERPIDLDPLVAPFYTEEEAAEYISLAFIFVDDVRCPSVVSFDWDGGDRPMSWDGEINQVRKGNRAYVMVPPDVDTEQDWQALAVIEPADHRAAWRSFIVDLLGSNGVAYGIEMFGSWPSNMTNHVPELIDEATIARARSRWAEEHPGW